MEYESVIGLEVHAQLKTRSKMFCSCSTDFGAPPNSNTCPVCLALPGTLPVINKKAVEYGIMAALALNCEINRKNIFARKNYFYPDLPKGYQISQYEQPLAVNGYLIIKTENGERKIRIKRVHMEEDAGKLIHDEEGKGWSYVDLNRAGIPLLEIVTEPDIRSPSEAEKFVRELRLILLYLGICDGNLEEGSLRCDANVSVRPAGSNVLGTKTEIKNMNSFKFIEKALEFEIRRQINILESNGEVVQETRLWDPGKGMTLPMRTKEEAHDYRYFPDPDLIPVFISDEWIEEVKKKMPPLPEDIRRKFKEEYGLPEYDTEILSSDPLLANYFLKCVDLFYAPKEISNWIMVEFLKNINEKSIPIDKSPVPPENLVELIRLVDEGIVSRLKAKDILEEMFETGKRAAEIVAERGYKQLSSEEELSKIVDEVLNENPKEVERYKKGEKKLFGFFMGRVMKKTEGNASPAVLQKILKKKLEGVS